MDIDILTISNITSMFVEPLSSIETTTSMVNYDIYLSQYLSSLFYLSKLSLERPITGFAFFTINKLNLKTFIYQ